METVATPLPESGYSDTSRYSKLSVLTFIVLAWFHIQAVAAFWSFTWTNLAVSTFLYWVAGGLGISMGYHRLHTHRGFKTYRWFEYFLALCATLMLEGGPIFWVATHRRHHQYSDQPEDPHTPRVSGFWAHLGWMIFGQAGHNNTTRNARYAPDLAKDPFYRWLTTYHWLPLTVLGFSLLAIGGWGLVNWAIFLRVVLGQHSTWLVNSATHMWGRRRFATTDDSRNLWWVALITFGEGWHNNHHAHPTSSRHGLAWYEFDLTWVELRLLKALGLVWDVRAVSISESQGASEAAS